MINQRQPMERATNESDQCLCETQRGRCLMRKLEGTDYCQIHAGNRQLIQKKRDALYNHHRTQYLSSETELDKHKYDVSEELGVLRLMLQKYLEKVEDFQTMMTYDPKINALVDKIQKLSDSVLKADQKIGTLMSEDDALAIGQGLLDVVFDTLSIHIQDENDFAEAMTAIGEKFEKVINERGSTET